VSRDFSLHEKLRDDEPVKTGSDRAFGYTVGGVAIAIGAVKAVLAGVLTPLPSLLIVGGGGLLVLALLAPARLGVLNRLWLKLGATMAKVVNPIVLVALFFFIVAPMALVMRLAGKRPLHLAFDPSADSYWIKREPSQAGESTMRQQF
jgi:amino acid transporter